jgi:hypothetical protein
MIDDDNNATVTSAASEMIITLTPAQVAEAIWSMNSEAQAEMFHELYQLSEGSHYLMMQFMGTRDKCVERKQRDSADESLDAFQAMFSSAYKWIW